MSNEWYEALPEELKGAPVFKPGEDGVIKSMEQVVSDLTNLTQVAGNSLRMPGADAGEKDIADFQKRVMEKVPGLVVAPNLEDPDNVNAHFTKLGKPDKPESYKVPEIEGFELKDPGVIKAQAHAMNMTQGQFDTFVTAQATSQAATAQDQSTAWEEQTSVIKTEWGAAFEQNHTAIGKLLKENKLVPPEMVAAFDADQLPASTMRWLYNLSELGAEGSTFQQQNEGDDKIPTPDEALAQLEEVEKRIYADGMEASSPEYKRLLARRMKLMAQAYPKAGTDPGVMRA